MSYEQVWDQWRENGAFFKRECDPEMDVEFLEGLLWCINNDIKIFQNYSELYRLWSLVKSASPSCMLEIGCAYGGSLFMFTRALNRKARIIAIDLPNSQGGAADCEESFHKVITKLENEGRDIHTIIGDSRADETFKQYSELIENHPPGFIFLDGGHSFDTVNDDFSMYGKTISKGGFIALHDISEKSESWIEVPGFWNMLKAFNNLAANNKRKIEEIIILDCIGGIGVVWF